MAGLGSFVEGFQGALSRGQDIYAKSVENDKSRRELEFQEALRQLGGPQTLTNEAGLTTVDPDSLRGTLDEVQRLATEHYGPVIGAQMRNQFVETYRQSANQYLDMGLAALNAGNPEAAAQAFNSALAWLPDGQFMRAGYDPEQRAMFWESQGIDGSSLGGGPVGPLELGAFMRTLRYPDAWHGMTIDERTVDVAEFNAQSQHEDRVGRRGLAAAQLALDRERASGSNAEAIAEREGDVLDHLRDEREAYYADLSLLPEDARESIQVDELYQPEVFNTYAAIATAFATTPGIGIGEAAATARDVILGGAEIGETEDGLPFVRSSRGLTMPLNQVTYNVLAATYPEQFGVAAEE